MKWISAYVASCLGSQRKSRKTRWVATRSTGWLLLGQHEEAVGWWEASGYESAWSYNMHTHIHKNTCHIFLTIIVCWWTPNLLYDSHFEEWCNKHLMLQYLCDIVVQSHSKPSFSFPRTLHSNAYSGCTRSHSVRSTCEFPLVHVLFTVFWLGWDGISE